MDIQKVKSIGKELQDSFSACSQCRSDYELSVFNIFDHETPQRQFKQCVDEMSRKVANIGRLELAIEELEDKIQHRKRQESEDTYQGRATRRKRQQDEINLWETQLHLEGQLKEFASLYSMYQQMPHFTAEQIQAADAEYHRLRKTATAQRQIETGRGVDPELLRVLGRQGIITHDYSDRFNQYIAAADQTQLDQPT